MRLALGLLLAAVTVTQAQHRPGRAAAIWDSVHWPNWSIECVTDVAIACPHTLCSGSPVSVRTLYND
jgi:hypothetical protein